MHPVNYTGKTFGYVTILEKLLDTDPRLNHISNKYARRVFYLGQCVCGITKPVRVYDLMRSPESSCGCKMRETLSKKKIVHGHSLAKPTREYTAWAHMMQRCNNASNKSYKNYGGRGIKIRDGLDCFDTFVKHIDPHPGAGYTINRIDNEGDYCIGNIEWATYEDQCNNKRNNRNVTIEGVTHTLAEWCKLRGLVYKSVAKRIYKYGFSPEQALTIPMRVGGATSRK